jgi:hypothetical protein
MLRRLRGRADGTTCELRYHPARTAAALYGQSAGADADLPRRGDEAMPSYAGLYQDCWAAASYWATTLAGRARAR